jgi:hypothetical protein
MSRPLPLAANQRLMAEPREGTRLKGKLRLWDIFSSEADIGRSASAYEHRDRDDYGSPLTTMVHRSDVASLVREGLHKVRDPVGYRKMAAKRAEYLDANRTMDERATVIGRYRPGLREQLEPVGPAGELARRVAQATGSAVQDTQRQGLQGIYWFMNAPEAMASAVGQTAQYNLLRESRGRKLPFTDRRIGQRDAVSPAGGGGAGVQEDAFRTAGVGLRSSIPFIATVGIASGTILPGMSMAGDGYKAVLPDPEDSSRTTNPLGEAALRVVGRKGSLQAYSDFQKARPDVSKGDYLRYQAYLQGNRNPIKATMEGIHGPEVNLFGKSIPLLTGLAPLAAGVIGARRGYRAAGLQAAGRGLRGKDPAGTRGPDRFQRLYNARQHVKELQMAGRDRDTIQEARVIRDRAQVDVDRRLLAGSLAGSSLAIGAAATIGAGLEQVRRANNWQANKESAARSVNYLEQELQQQAGAAIAALEQQDEEEAAVLPLAAQGVLRQKA